MEQLWRCNLFCASTIPEQGQCLCAAEAAISDW